MPENVDTSVDHQARVEIARWTHTWMCAAARTHELLESIWDEESPASSIGARDALSLVVIDAVRNTYRGAAAALGPNSDPVRAFEERQPDLKVVRDRFEHFEDYLRGAGRAQMRRGEVLVLDHLVGLEIRSSSGGGPCGHSIEVAVRERDGEKTYFIEIGAAVDAVRALAPAVLVAVGLYDDRHADRCAFCSRLDSSPGA